MLPFGQGVKNSAKVFLGVPLGLLSVGFLLYIPNSISSHFQDGRSLQQLVVDLSSSRMSAMKHFCLDVIRRCDRAREMFFTASTIVVFTV